MPPKKKPRRSSRRAASKSSSAASQEYIQKTLEKPCTFQSIGEDTVRCILSYLLTLSAPTATSGGWKAHRRYNDAKRVVSSHCRTLICVSKEWRDASRVLINQQAPTDVISPCDLAELKASAMGLCLDDIKRHFLREVIIKWGPTGLDPYGDPYRAGDKLISQGIALGSIFERYGGSGQAFADSVALEYKKFLVVKCIENIASRIDHDTPAVRVWKEKCQPSQLIDMFWHAHMLCPRKYLSDCEILVQEVIDHDAGYFSPNEHSGSDIQSKKKLLFQLEAQLPKFHVVH